jgi:hypothetical protein
VSGATIRQFLAGRRLRLRGEHVGVELVVVGVLDEVLPEVGREPHRASAIGAGSCECSMTSMPCTFSSSWAILALGVAVEDDAEDPVALLLEVQDRGDHVLVASELPSRGG